MVINGKKYRINVLILCLPDEIDVTIMTINGLLNSVEDSVVISVLLNGGVSEQLLSLQVNQCVKVYQVDSNLGVAGGRNFLLQTDECRNSDVVMILDNDVVPPRDYLRRLASFLLNTENAGIVGALVIDINQYLDTRGLKGLESIIDMDCESVKQKTLVRLDDKTLFHAGISPNFRYAYFSILPVYLGLLGFKAKYHPEYKYNIKQLNMIRNGIDHYEVSTVAGCSQAFTRDTLEKIGMLDDRFSPYGFEDAEFCYRAIESGYKNFIDTTTLLFHGTDNRHKQRDYRSVIINHYRARTIFAAIVYPGSLRYKFVMIKLIIGAFFIELAQRPVLAFKLLKARISGYQNGRLQV